MYNVILNEVKDPCILFAHEYARHPKGSLRELCVTFANSAFFFEGIQ